MVSSLSEPEKLTACRRFGDDYQLFARLSAMRPARFQLRDADLIPCLRDRTPAVSFDHHYVYHTGWAARRLAELAPRSHVDISSSVYFAMIASAFVPIRHYDLRSPNLEIEGLQCGFADLLRLPFPDGSLHSLSCMHVVEHIGLGRYGDPIDPEGDLAAISELRRVLAVGGVLMLVVPVGAEARVHFNAHRVYTYEQVLTNFVGFELEEFALVLDSESGGGLMRHASAELARGQRYGCGCFCFRRSRASDDGRSAHVSLETGEGASS